MHCSFIQLDGRKTLGEEIKRKKKLSHHLSIILNTPVSTAFTIAIAKRLVHQFFFRFVQLISLPCSFGFDFNFSPAAQSQDKELSASESNHGRWFFFGKGRIFIPA